MHLLHVALSGVCFAVSLLLDFELQQIAMLLATLTASVNLYSDQLPHHLTASIFFWDIFLKLDRVSRPENISFLIFRTSNRLQVIRRALFLSPSLPLGALHAPRVSHSRFSLSLSPSLFLALGALHAPRVLLSSPSLSYLSRHTFPQSPLPQDNLLPPSSRLCSLSEQETTRERAPERARFLVAVNVLAVNTLAVNGALHALYSVKKCLTHSI